MDITILIFHFLEISFKGLKMVGFNPIFTLILTPLELDTFLDTKFSMKCEI